MTALLHATLLTTMLFRGREEEEGGRETWGKSVECFIFNKLLYFFINIDLRGWTHLMSAGRYLEWAIMKNSDLTV